MKPTQQQIEAALRYADGKDTSADRHTLANYAHYVCDLTADPSTGCRKMLAFALRDALVEIEDLQSCLESMHAQTERDDDER